jgi:hypothetical protein
MTSIHVGIFFQTPYQTDRNGLDVQKVTKATSRTGFFVKVPTPSLSKVCHRTEFDLHPTAVVEPGIHYLERIGGVFFVSEFTIDVSNHVIS